MDKEKRILEEVDKTLKVFDDLPKLEANQFLFTRIQAKLGSEGVSDKNYLLKKFKFRYIVLAVIVIFNIITAVYFFKSDNRDYTKDELIYSLSKDYNSTQNEF